MDGVKVVIPLETTSYYAWNDINFTIFWKGIVRETNGSGKKCTFSLIVVISQYINKLIREKMVVHVTQYLELETLIAQIIDFQKA